MSKLDEMWAALEAHKPAPEYAEAWERMCRERTRVAASAACKAAPKWFAAWSAATSAWVAADAAEQAAWSAVEAEQYAQKAIDAINEVKP